MKVAGWWVYLYRAIDQFGQVIDVLVAEKQDLAATRRFFTSALEHGLRLSEVSTHRAAAYPRVLDELLPAACHGMEQYANNPIESDHGQLKARVTPTRGLNCVASAAGVVTLRSRPESRHRASGLMPHAGDETPRPRAALDETGMRIVWLCGTFRGALHWQVNVIKWLRSAIVLPRANDAVHFASLANLDLITARLPDRAAGV